MTLVKNSGLAGHLGLQVSGDELTALLVRCSVLVLDYADLPGGTVEYYDLHPRYKSMDLGCLLAAVKDKNGYSEPEFYWNDSGRKAVMTLFQKLQFMDCREIAEIIIRDSLNSSPGCNGATDKPCCKNCGTDDIPADNSTDEF